MPICSTNTFLAFTIRSPTERYGEANVRGDTKCVVSWLKSSLDHWTVCSRLWLFLAIGRSIANSKFFLGLNRPFTRSIYLRGAIVDVGAGVRSNIGFRKDVVPPLTTWRLLPRSCCLGDWSMMIGLVYFLIGVAIPGRLCCC